MGSDRQYLLKMASSENFVKTPEFLLVPRIYHEYRDERISVINLVIENESTLLFHSNTQMHWDAEMIHSNNGHPKCLCELVL